MDDAAEEPEADMDHQMMPQHDVGEAVRQRAKQIVTTVKISAGTMEYYKALRKYGEAKGLSYNKLMNMALVDYARRYAGCWLTY